MRKFAVAAATAVAITIGLAVPAFAIEQVDCGQAGAVKINWRDQTGTARSACFDEVGELGVGLPRSSSVESGDNAGWIQYSGAGGEGFTKSFGPGVTIPLDGWTITRVRIF